MKESYCSTCGQELKPGELSIRCRLCMHNYHARCWEKTGGCTTWGCAGKSSLEEESQSVAYKRCRFCGEEIIAFATKCRYCRSPLEESELSGEEISSKRNRTTGSGFRKDPILTGLLNLIFPGAGYMYLGQFSKGMIWFIIAVAAWFFTRGLGLVAVYIWVIYDSSREAVMINRGMPSKKETIQRP